LTPRELAVMKTYWRHGAMTADGARLELAADGERLSYPTVANVVRSLVDKGYLKATNSQRPFVYQSIRTFEDVSKRIVGDLISRLFSGSREEMLVNLLERRKLTAREKAYLHEILQQQAD
ncbi:MAG: BlaI/MecI/CopY family transcriptional regulator, partial [Planctomycetota bacterium]